MVESTMSTSSKRSKFSLDDTQNEQMINQHLGRSRKNKGDRTRRSWSDREEEILVTTLKDLVVHGWKSDNGFRAGYLGKIEDALKAQFPSTDIKATPHIISKVTAMKKSYGSLVGILSRSGVGFNAKGDYKIDCDDEQWDHIVKHDPNARFMRSKSWPYWQQWQTIFGKDRASGTFTEDVMEAVNELYSLDNMNTSIDAGVQQVNPEDQPTPDPAGGTSTPEGVADNASESLRDNATSNSSGKKRKTEQGIDGLIHMLERLHEDTNARLETLSLRIGYEFDLSKARKEVFELLGRLPGLTREQKFDVGEIILEKVERLDFFLGMPDDDRLAYVCRSLAKYT